MLTHSIRLTNEAIIDPQWGCWLAQSWPLSGSSLPDNAENVRVTVFAAWHSLPKSNLSKTNHSAASLEEPPASSTSTGQWRNLIFFFYFYFLYKAWRGGKLTCAICSASSRWKWRDTSWPFSQLRMSGVLFSLQPTSCAHWCCLCCADE